MNGVEAVGNIPMQLDHVQPVSQELDRQYTPAAQQQYSGSTIMSEQQARATLKFQQREYTPAAQQQRSGSTIMSEQQARTTLKFQQGKPVGPASGAPQGTMTTDQQVRSTMKGQSFFRTPADAGREFANGLIMSGINLKGTQKNPSTYRSAPISTNIRSGVMMTDKSVRFALKTASAENPFRLAGNPAVEAGQLISSLSSLKPTMKLAMQETFPITQIQGDDAGYVVVDHEVRPTMKDADPYREYGAPVSRGDFGENLGAGDISSNQHRGCIQQQYLPSLSMVPAGANGTSARVVQPLNRQVRYTKEDIYNRFGPVDMPTNNRFSIGPIRPTIRSGRECQELADDMLDM